MLPNRMTGSWITLPTDALRIYFNLCIIKYFLNIISPNNDMKAKVDALLAAYPSTAPQPANAMSCCCSVAPALLSILTYKTSPPSFASPLTI